MSRTSASKHVAAPTVVVAIPSRPAKTASDPLPAENCATDIVPTFPMTQVVHIRGRNAFEFIAADIHHDRQRIVPERVPLYLIDD
jgi:hypothetical protein